MDTDFGSATRTCGPTAGSITGAPHPTRLRAYVLTCARTGRTHPTPLRAYVLTYYCDLGTYCDPHGTRRACRPYHLSSSVGVRATCY